MTYFLSQDLEIVKRKLTLDYIKNYETDIRKYENVFSSWRYSKPECLEYALNFYLKNIPCFFKYNFKLDSDFYPDKYHNPDNFYIMFDFFYKNYPKIFFNKLNGFFNEDNKSFIDEYFEKFDLLRSKSMLQYTKFFCEKYPQIFKKRLRSKLALKRLKESRDSLDLIIQILEKKQRMVKSSR